MTDILCWIELEDGAPTTASLELLGEAAEIARVWQAQVVALVLSETLEANIQTELALVLGSYGADELLIAEHPTLASYCTERYTWAVAEIVKSESYSALLAPASPNGSDFMPRLAARLNAALVTDCLRLTGDLSGKLRLTRPVYGDRLHTLYEAEPSEGQPILATLRPGVRGVSILPGRAAAKIRQLVLDGEPGQQRSLSLAITPPDPRSVDIVEAERIVAVGLGVSRTPGIEQAQTLADTLGAALGATRPVVDKGWLPFPRQIGTTGRTVAPRLYIALGISGANQHIGGIRGAKVIVSINPDRSAPIMALSDLAIVGDAAQIVPILVKSLRSKQANF